MFTGIIQEIGTVTSIRSASGGKRLSIRCRTSVQDQREGASISVDGACLTVEGTGRDRFDVFASEKTCRLTTIGALKTGTRVHLERPLQLNAELGGHLVLGHVDGLGTVTARKIVSDTLHLEIDLPDGLMYGVIPEGSIAVNGVSLTVAGCHGNTITLVIIPYTRRDTTLDRLRVGDRVNLEIDVIGKYLYKFFQDGPYGKR